MSEDTSRASKRKSRLHQLTTPTKRRRHAESDGSSEDSVAKNTSAQGKDTNIAAQNPNVNRTPRLVKLLIPNKMQHSYKSLSSSKNSQPVPMENALLLILSTTNVDALQLLYLARGVPPERPLIPAIRFKLDIQSDVNCKSDFRYNTLIYFHKSLCRRSIATYASAVEARSAPMPNFLGLLTEPKLRFHVLHHGVDTARTCKNRCTRATKGFIVLLTKVLSFPMASLSISGDP
ncbi:uncharacterized protein PITG_19297 [Phytophthora infestans T30-4]|uniref:Uncharacterized protein n=1 Tax=Phytophthora infestans (strain T30-4) TaxID=403677 RepID=D0NZW2_PHYIT|nr:uncharacterized protein PITG_19297 [Phytophthora infestans T30-4]EEY69678.1 conserved hypothetical protein [Phytophthora infestans T30-4]|eukprot:XP_002997090.1 conserved hypothetical protein [Phytophthora infestans T30-4]